MTNSLEEAVLQLEGMVFKGSFQRNEYVVRTSIKLLDSLDTSSSKYRDKKREYEIANGPHDFSLKILSYKVESGMIIAEGEDIFGDSCVAGEMTRYDDISFRIELMKTYIGKAQKPEGRFERFRYSGFIHVNGGIVVIEGNYNPELINESYSGTFKLESVELIKS